jgi:hypothetical protein
VRQAFFNPALFLVGFMGHLLLLVYGNNFDGHDNIIGKIRVKEREKERAEPPASLIHLFRTSLPLTALRYGGAGLF